MNALAARSCSDLHASLLHVRASPILADGDHGDDGAGLSSTGAGARFRKPCHEASKYDLRQPESNSQSSCK
jgi:hypothetical protein